MQRPLIGATQVRCLGAMVLGYASMAGAFETMLLGWGWSTPAGGVWLFMVLTLLLSLCQFPMATTITSVSTSRVPPQLKGTLVGAEHATFAFAGLLGPSPGVAILERAGLCGVAAGTAAVDRSE